MRDRAAGALTMAAAHAHVVDGAHQRSGGLAALQPTPSTLRPHSGPACPQPCQGQPDAAPLFTAVTPSLLK